MLAGMLVVTVGTLWAVFTATESPTKLASNAKPPEASKVTNVGVMAGGAQVKPLDQWIGDAGRKMAQYERDKENQEKRNKDNASVPGAGAASASARSTSSCAPSRTPRPGKAPPRPRHRPSRRPIRRPAR